MSDMVGRQGPDRPRWIDSGSGGGFQHRDERPGYAPAAVIVELQRVLREAGVTVDPTPNQLHVASLAAADLLRALGVRPEVAPHRARQP